jgi:hypothetical protein
MRDRENWDWETGERLIADLSTWTDLAREASELDVSDDGERIAGLHYTGDGEVSPVVNGHSWTHTFERVWPLRFLPDGRLCCLAMVADEWNVFVNDQPWDAPFDFIWNLCHSQNGDGLTANVRKDMAYSVIHNGKTWDTTFPETRDVIISSDGSQTAAIVQTERLAEADLEGFFRGIYTVAVAGEPWPSRFINVWTATFSDDGLSVAAEVRTGRCEYTIAVDGQPWPGGSYKAVWAPAFRPGTHNVIAPVLAHRGWTLAMDGDHVWDRPMTQLWHQTFSADGRRIAAVASLKFGEWTVVVDGIPWKTTYRDAVLKPVFAGNGESVAAIVKDKGRWCVAVDDIPWDHPFDMVWGPVLSPDGAHVVAKVERDGRYTLAINGRTWQEDFQALWDPIFDPSGSLILIRCIQDHKYYRVVKQVTEIFH